MDVITAGYLTQRPLTVEVVRLSDFARLDWADNTFKSVGWGLRLKPLTEDSLTSGWYTAVVDPSTWPLTSEYSLILADASTVGSVIGIAQASVAAGKLVQHSTLLSDVARRLALVSGAKITQTLAQQKVTREDASVAATSPVTSDGVTETLGPTL